MANNRINLTGQRFGQLTVKALAPKRGRRTAWFCECDCGTVTQVMTLSLRSKVRPTRSCGCLIAINTRKVNTIHGGRRTPEYRCWSGLITRCTNPRAKDYPRYGGRGITVCDRWRTSFEHFYADMGRRPSPRMSIDRYPNNDGHYEPSNCRWATSQQQARNRRRPQRKHADKQAGIA